MSFVSWAKGLLIPAICIGLVCGSSVLSHAADFKAGKVHLVDVWRSSTKVKTAMEELKKFQVDADAKTVPMKERVGTIHEQLKSADKPVTPEEKDKLQTELKEKLQEIENVQQAAKAKITFKQKSIQNSFLNQVGEVLKKLGEKDGLSAIFGSETILYSNAVADLTAEVVKELDAMPPFESSKQ
jgi:Skp family chaperone for outer membrane proteins